MRTLDVVNAYVAVRRAQGVGLNSSVRVLRQTGLHVRLETCRSPKLLQRQ